MGTSTSSSSSSSNTSQAGLLEKAWTDRNFKTRLINDPVTVCAEERVDISKYLPANYKKGDKIPVTIPDPPANIGTMTLAQIQAAASTTMSSGAEMF